jgi:two-component system nitrogen regulation response regulator GlnG
VRDSQGALDRELQTRTHSQGQPVPPASAVLVPCLTVLCHPVAQRVGERAFLTGLTAGGSEALSRSEPLFSPPGSATRRPLADPFLSRAPVRLVPGAAGAAPGTLRVLCGETRTEVRIGSHQVAGEAEVTAAEIAAGVVIELARRVVLALCPADPLGAADGDRLGMVGESLAMQQLRLEVARLAPLDLPVLVRGETGSGKELIASALHTAGPRARRPFVAVNMAAIPPALAAAELFGAARGAYTGAERSREGFFGQAEGGTLFLDELGETPPEVQALLLRVLETGEIQPVGGGRLTRADVRLIAATDLALEEAVTAGRFRAPLLHRLSACQVEAPPLRRRRDDIGRLLVHFLRLELAAMGAAWPAAGAGETSPWPPAPLVARLAALDWPGNVRQLRNAARLLALSHGQPAGGPASVALTRMLDEAAAGARGDGTGRAGGMRGAEPPGGGAGGTAAVIRPDGGAGTPDGGAMPPVHAQVQGAAEAQPDGAAAPGGGSTPRPGGRARKVYRPIEEVSDEELLAALAVHRYRLQPAAAHLGVARSSLYDRLAEGSGPRTAAALGRQEIADCRARHGGNLDRMVEELRVSKSALKRRIRQLGL